MPMQSWVETLIASTADGTAYTGTAAATILPPEDNLVFPSGFFNFSGKTLMIRGTGRITTPATAGTLTLSVRFGGSAVNVATFTTSTLVASQTNASFWLEWKLQQRGVGSTATFMHVAQLQSLVIGGTSPIASTAILPATAPVVGTAFNAALAQTFDLQATFSLASHSLTLHTLVVESLN